MSLISLSGRAKYLFVVPLVLLSFAALALLNKAYATDFLLNPSGDSHIYWPMADGSTWNNSEQVDGGPYTQQIPFGGNLWKVVSGSGSHTGADVFADDWNWGSGNADAGRPLKAVGDGTVIYVQNTRSNGDGSCTNPNFGNQVIIRFSSNNSYAVRYTHLQSVDSSIYVGKPVKVGDPIGQLGYSGLSGVSPCTAHLHIVLYDGIYDNSTALTNLQVGGMPPSTSAATFYVDATSAGGGGTDCNSIPAVCIFQINV